MKVVVIPNGSIVAEYKGEEIIDGVIVIDGYVLNDFEIVDINIEDNLHQHDYRDGVLVEKVVLVPIQVPQSITPLQAKLQLLAMGLLDEVETMVATDRKVQLYWSEALEIKRDHQTLLQMALALGLSDAQLDEMFIEADKLS